MPGMGPMGPGGPGGFGGGPHGPGPGGGPHGPMVPMVPGAVRTSGFGGYYSRPAATPVDKDPRDQNDKKPVDDWSLKDNIIHFIRWRWFG